MLTEKNLSATNEVETSKTQQNNDDPDSKNKYNEKVIDLFRDSEEFSDQFESKSPKMGFSGSQELTLSYLRDNSKLGDKKLLICSYKGKKIVSLGEDLGDNRWVERDFLQFNELKENSSKRDVERDEIERGVSEKKPKIETLNLSLSLSDASLSLAASDPVRERSNWSSQAPSNNNTQMTQSNDFTTGSMSYSYSQPFSHNPSCSMTRNSTGFEYSMGSHRRDYDRIWNAGEGTNGSVHSRFRPVGDGSVAFSNQGGNVFSFMQNRETNKDNNNSLHNGTSSDNLSFFPSELPARLKMDAQLGDSRGRGPENVKERSDGGQARRLSTPERIIRQIISESVPVMSQIVQELTEETLESMKEYMKTLISSPERRGEIMSLQNRLELRSDLTKETLSKCSKNQLDIFVSIKMGHVSFLNSKLHIPTTELVEIFLLERCRNVSCKRVLPVEDCECKICTTKKGFCSECMCPICFKFDCASKTCSWVGCDVCSHWCHTACGIKKNLIKPSAKPKGTTTEVYFHCLGCDHASEMFGFVKDVLMNCATGWDLVTLVKELDCVRKIFKECEDSKGRVLRRKADEMIIKLESKMMSPLDVCNLIFQFFKYTDDMSTFPSYSTPPKDLAPITQNTLKKDVSPHLTLLPKQAFYDNNLNANIDDEWSVKAPSKKDNKEKNSFESLESVVRIKEVEARMFQNHADVARREAEDYRTMVRMKREKLDEEYRERREKLCLKETEERRREKVEEMKALENAHCDYYKMKMRMQGEIVGLLDWMDATKKQVF